MSELMRNYYNIEMGGYLYAIFMIPYEPKQTKKDLVAYLIHHTATLLLLWLSYIYSFHRGGIIVAVLHDVSDPLMELAKIVLYAGYNKIADMFFGLFALTFIVTRNGLLPFMISLIPRYLVYPDGSYMPSNFIMRSIQLFLCTLELLHIYWATLIIKMAYKALVEKGVSDDIRDVDQEKSKVQ
ncbi:TRAM/LAG1/CLN8 homology domain-containing protein [Globomyces pollinis-pini]|nr:TRAM/LAG1/CLN8 homology domain-containing protein [Globomyces pollinis-pini]